MPVLDARACRAQIIRASNPAYFIHNHCKVRSDDGSDAPFHMWPAQVEALETMHLNRLVAMLKARQTGFTTLVAGYCVWLAIYKPGSVILLFSKSHREAKALLARIRTTIKKLPEWLQPKGFTSDTTTELKLSNGSEIISFGSNTSGGDSYTANLVVIDEADLIRNLDTLLSGAKPTIDAGGKLVMLSRTDKANQDSSFKRICREALKPGTDSKYKILFFPWWVRPGRNQTWYDEQAAEIEQRTFSKDELYANYPATPEQALAARELDKRFPMKWLEDVFEPLDPLPVDRLKNTPFAGWKNLEIYKLPEAGRKYCVGIDVAGGNPNSDDSVATVVDKETLEECAVLCGKIEPTVHAHRSAQLAEFYNRAEIMPEKNHTHGAKCLETLKLLKCRILFGHDHKPGWFTDMPRKQLAMDHVAEAVRQKQCIIHAKATLDQLASLDVTELAAPFGQHDDRAIAFSLAVQGCSRRLKSPDIQVISGAPGVVSTGRVPRYKGTRYIATYDCWIGSVEHGGQRVDVGDYEEERAAAAATDCAHALLGTTAPNGLEVDDGTRERVRKLLAEKGVTVNQPN